MKNISSHYLIVCGFMLTLSLPLRAQENSLGAAPFSHQTKKPDGITKIFQEAATTGYGTNALANNILTSVPIPAGLPLTPIGSGQAMLVQGGEFGPGGIYYGTQGNNQLLRVNTTTGSYSIVAPISGVTGGQTITALGFHEASNTMYMGTTNITSSQLYKLNVTTGAATLIGNIGQPGLIAIAVRCNGEIYSHDIIQDNIWSINPITGQGTPIGPTGFDANFCQDADFDNEADVMYLAAYNNGNGGSELRTVNLATGGTTLVASWGSTEFCGFGIIATCGPPCPVGEPTNPSPPNGATNRPITGNTLSWTNGTGTLYNEVYFEDSLVYDGPGITSFSLAPFEPLEYNTWYSWRVVCKNDTCNTGGPEWTFKTMQDPLLPYVEIFFDDFTAGLSNWTITNDGGTCIWDLRTTTSNAYTLPAAAEGNILGADSDFCGSGTTIRSTAYINEPLDLGGHTQWCYYSIWIEFDNDWRIIDSEDEAHVELSTDGGSTWFSVWSKIGVDARNSHEFINIPNFVNGQSDVRLRLRNIQPGWDWWWVIDNFAIRAEYCLSCTRPARPTNLTASATAFQEVTLNWQDNSNNEIEFIIERKDGDSLSTNMFYVLANVPANSTSYHDNSVTDSSVYTYRVKTYNSYCHSPYSNLAQVLAWIPVELVSFSANVIGNNIELSWITATELNNLGFEILRSAQNDVEWKSLGFVEGKGTTTEMQYYRFTDKNLTIGKYQYRLKQIDYDGTHEYLRTVEAEIEPPKEYVLEQNYPNPFNPNTKISWQSPISSKQKLIIYDVLGNEVAILLDEYKPAGSYEIEFDASKLSSGIYYYELRAGEYRSIKKMVLLR